MVAPSLAAVSEPAQLRPLSFDLTSPDGTDAAIQAAFEDAKEESLLFIESATARIAQNEGGDAALRELQAFLLYLLSHVERDPGLAIAADDLFGAAAAIRNGFESGRLTIDMRSRRLLNDAAQRFRARLRTARLRKEAVRSI